VSGPGATVTVVIPVWDVYVQFLADAIESVKRNAPQAPIVVVDNASSTPVPEFECCAIVRAPHRLSVGAARNLGLDQVETDYVVVLDADDMLLEATLDFLHSRIAADPGLAVSATSILEGETGERHRSPRRFVERLVRWPRFFALAHTIWSLFPIQGCAILRTDQVRKAGGYPDAHWGDDWVLATSLAFRGRVEVSARMGLFYRPTQGSLWRRHRPPGELVASARLVRDRLRSDPGVPGWARALLPAIAVLQLAAIYVARPVYLAARRRSTARQSNIC
jgi:glycosyltransferase involved in cell wall biosynthesis